MTYTVNKLAKLASISVRTLHYYDQIDLLKPAFIGDNGYRYYDETQLLRLQQILFYRELDFALDDIKRILDSDDFDQLESLQQHKEILLGRMNQTKKLIHTIEKTMQHLRGKVMMKDEELFYGFDSDRQKKYEQYLIDQGIVTEKRIEKGRDQIKDWSDNDWQKIKEDMNQLHLEFVQCIDDGLTPNSEKVQKLVQQHFEWVSRFWTPNRESYIGLSQQYTSGHPDWEKFYHHYHPQLAEYLAHAMCYFAEQKLD